MNEGIAKIVSVLLCVVMLTDVSALTSIQMIDTGSPVTMTGSPKTIWVDDDFVDDPPNHKWDTIKEGIDDADAGDTVYVFNGTYYERVFLHETISLTGEDHRGTVISGDGIADAIWVGADWVNITQFSITNSGENAAISLNYVQNCHISDNDLSNSREGIVLYASDNNIIANNSASLNEGGGITLSGSNSNTLRHNTMSKNGQWGIWIDYSKNNILTDNVMVEDGILMWGHSLNQWNTHVIDTSNTVNGNPVFYWKNTTGGKIPSRVGQVILANSNDVIVHELDVSGGSVGITLGFSHDNFIDGNTGLSNDLFGLLLVHSDRNHVIHNDFLHNGDGISLYYSDRNSLVFNNASSNNWDGFWLDSSNDNVVHYNDAAFNNLVGIRVSNSENNLFNHNDASYNGWYGIELTQSGNNRITYNTARHNDLYGIHFIGSNNNTILHNTISSNSFDGISFNVSNSGNVISDNFIRSNNEHGIRFVDKSTDNLVFHNNLMDNPKQAFDINPGSNDWHHPVLLEGNYWSDYLGVDDGSGTGKHAIAGDSIGDTLIPHPEPDYDFYPFTQESGWMFPQNKGPVADAGPDQTVYTGDVVQFDGSGSYDLNGGWVTTTVDSEGDVGEYASIALDSKDNPHISYYDATNGDLKYARWTGDNWSIETVDAYGDVGRSSSLALDSSDYPHISYYDYLNGGLKHARWNGSAWIVRRVDYTGSRVGMYTSIAVDSSDYSHISYVGEDASRRELRHARWTGSGWKKDTVTPAGLHPAYNSMILDSNDNPHISFYDGRSGDRGGGLRYAKWDGIAWNVELVDQSTPGSSLLVGGWSSIALDGYDHPHISYFDRKNESVKYAKWDGSAWKIEIVEIASLGETSIDLDSHGNPHLSYRNYTGQAVKYGKWNGSAWEIEIVNSSSHLLRYASMELDSNDNPHIGFYQGYPDFDLKFARKGKGIASYDWDFGDGSPHGSGVRPTHVYSISGVYNITLTVTDLQGAADTDNCIITVLPGNRPPVADANGPYNADEGSLVNLDGSSSHDPDGDTLQYRWDLNNDGIWDTGWSSSPYLEHTWGDDYSGNVVLQVWDGEFTDTDTANITVNNVAPTVELRMLPIYVNVSLRIAGEKWHDVSIELYEDDVLVAKGNLTRYPGSPNDQMLHLAGFEVNISERYYAIVRYTPEDDPINGQPNGANPCWIILTFDDGEEIRLHHNFNVQHPERYIWEADLSAAILSHGLRFEAIAYDPGADDLTFDWDFDDGTNITTFYPNVNKTFPVEITEVVTHVFPGRGTYTIALTVADDDGGSTTITMPITL